MEKEELDMSFEGKKSAVGCPAGNSSFLVEIPDSLRDHVRIVVGPPVKNIDGSLNLALYGIKVTEDGVLQLGEIREEFTQLISMDSSQVALTPHFDPESTAVPLTNKGGFSIPTQSTDGSGDGDDQLGMSDNKAYEYGTEFTASTSEVQALSSDACYNDNLHDKLKAQLPPFNPPMNETAQEGTKELVASLASCPSPPPNLGRAFRDSAIENVSHLQTPQCNGDLRKLFKPEGKLVSVEDPVLPSDTPSDGWGGFLGHLGNNTPTSEHPFLAVKREPIVDSTVATSASNSVAALLPVSDREERRTREEGGEQEEYKPAEESGSRSGPSPTSAEELSSGLVVGIGKTMAPRDYHSEPASLETSNHLKAKEVTKTRSEPVGLEMRAEQASDGSQKVMKVRSETQHNAVQDFQLVSNAQKCAVPHTPLPSQPNTKHLVPAVQQQESAPGEVVMAGEGYLLEPERMNLQLQGKSPKRQYGDDEEEESRLLTSSVSGMSNSRGTSLVGGVSEEDRDVHALEHACNGKETNCIFRYKKRLCRKLQRDRARVQGMQQAVAEYWRGGTVSDDLKQLIRVHCSHCLDPSCDVPHRAAGCLPRGDVSSSQQTSFSKTTSHSSSHPAVGIPDVSFDTQPFNDSRLWSTRSHGEPPHDNSLRSGTDHRPNLPNPNQCTEGKASSYNMQLLLPRRPEKAAVPPRGAAKELYVYHRLQGAAIDLRLGQPAPPASHSHGCYPASVAIPDASQGFLRYGEYVNRAYLPGTVLYSSEDVRTFLFPGSTIPLPDFDRIPERDFLGKGGNGDVIRYSLYGKEFAVKKTKYRPHELNFWLRFNHTNVVSLKAVVLGPVIDEHGYCFQFMTRMDGTLSAVLDKKLYPHGLSSLYNSVSIEEWERSVMPSFKHICRGILEGLEYIHSNDLRHCDIKWNNILIRKHILCTCPNAIQCKCPVDQKCEVKIADFDSLKDISHGNQCYANFQDGCYVQKTPEECRKFKGTIGYRPPEESYTRTDNLPVDGPWCDIYSFGRVVVELFLGVDRVTHDKDMTDASFLIHSPKMKWREMPLQAESVYADRRLLRLFSTDHYTLHLAAQFASPCLEPDFKNRPTIQQLLKDPFLRQTT